MLEVCNSVITFETSIFISNVMLVIALEAVGERDTNDCMARLH